MTISDGVSITEAARLLGTSRPTLSKLLSDHDFPRQKVGGKTLVSMAAVRQFYQDHKQGASRHWPKAKGQYAPKATAKAAQPEDELAKQLAELQQSFSQHKLELEQLRTQLGDGLRRLDLSRPQMSNAAASLQPATPKSRANSAGLSLLKVLKDMFRSWGNP